MSKMRCRGIPIGDGNYTGCAYGDEGLAPFTGPCDCPVCKGSGIEPHEPKSTTADHSAGVLSVKCPHCGTLNEFPGFNQVDVFICSGCGEPVEVKERQE